MTQTAEAVILGLCASLLGNDGQGAGLLTVRVNDRHHTARCQRGMLISPEDRARGGAPCSPRCQQVNAALTAAEGWLKTHEAPAQPRMEVAG